MFRVHFKVYWAVLANKNDKFFKKKKLKKNVLIISHTPYKTKRLIVPTFEENGTFILGVVFYLVNFR